MRRRTLISASLGWGLVGSSAGLALYTGADLAFGTTISIHVRHADAVQAQAAIAAALGQAKKVDALMSLHQPQSQVYRLNQHGVLDAPDADVLAVLVFAQQLAQRTAGAFDITVQPLWLAFHHARTQGGLPSAQAIAAAKALVDWRQLHVQPQQLRLGRVGMGVTLNGVAQGYAVDLALQALRAHGVQHALVDTGEHGALGGKAGAAWALGIAHPRQPGALVQRVRLEQRRVATSGDYASAFSADFVHHHIFDPASGDSPPALASATVLAPTGLMADGLSTAMMVLGVEQALALAASLPDVDALLIDKAGRVVRTRHFPSIHES